jgi:hypothetical protein
MFQNRDDLKRYIIENYPEVTDNRIDAKHWDLRCTHCKITRGFQVIKRELSGEHTTYGYGERRKFDRDFDAPITFVFQCPVCKMFKQWIVFEIELDKSEDKLRRQYFRVTSVPSEGLEDIEELPDDPPSLRIAYRQAIRSMDANAPLAAAVMFRRALQVITRDLLGAKPSPRLGQELLDVVGKSYNGVAVAKNFADVGFIIKEAGNQGAHPARDPDLLDFTPQDAEDLQDIFMELVSELFVVPAAIKKAKADFLARRKILTMP